MLNGSSNLGASSANGGAAGSTVTGVEKTGWTSPGAWLFPVMVWRWRR